MEPEDVLKYVYRNYRGHWKGTCGLNVGTFGPLLLTKHGKPLLPPLNSVEYNRVTSPKTTPGRVVEALRNEHTRRSVANALRCPDLFLCRTAGAIDAAMHKVAVLPRREPQPNTTSDCLVAPESLPDSEMALHPREKKAIEYLQGLITGGSSGVVYWPDAPTVGPSFIAYALAGTFLPKAGVGPVYLLRPYAGLMEATDWVEFNESTQPYEQGLAELCRVLEFTELRPSAERILRALKKRRAVLIVVNAGSVPARSSSETHTIVELIEEACKSDQKKQGPASIVLIGKPQGAVSSRATLARETRSLLAFGKSTDERNEITDERSEFFKVQWHRFRDLRSDHVADDLGARLKRVRQYYSADTGSAMWPCNIRMLAFLASNYGTFSYFDPTAGWHRLAGMSLAELPIDIRLHLEEVTAQARNAPEGMPAHTRRAVRWCSTALYWLTEDAAIDLGKLTSSPVSLEKFKDAVQKVPNLVEVTNEQGSQREIFKADLALRAVVQDQWANEDPLQRARAHHLIAQRLYNARDNKELLSVEFPVQPHWGRSRMHFLVETLRHLIRTCERTPRPRRDQGAKAPFMGSQFFPAAPSETWRGCDPYEVINFCFGDIFWQMLNGNSRVNTIHNRKLARQHGAYQLTGELLQLMSEDGKLGKPHWALHKEHVQRYLREVAYAQLDFGDLSNAERSFRALIEQAEATGAAGVETLEYRLDLVVVLTAQEDLDAAQECLEEVSSAVGAMPKQEEGNYDAKHQRQTLRNRLEAREAQLRYLRGDLHGALAIYNRLQEGPPGLIVRDVAHGYIATLGAIGSQEELKQAMSICVSNLFTNSSRGMHHEALGFRVALGHLFRRLGMADVAEATLDRVFHDVLQYGCSERTYLALLLESGRTVSMQPRRDERAYAAYLRPCFDRAVTRGFVRTARTAQRHAIACLERLLTLPCDKRTVEDLQEALTGRGSYQSPVRAIATDPQYSFSADLLDQWVERLQNRAALQQELADLRELLAPSIADPATIGWAM